MTESQKTGSNYIVQTDHHFPMDKAAPSTFPWAIHWQVNSCTREKRNRFWLDYPGVLTKWSVSESVEAEFLSALHTHENIDQVFSKKSNVLHQKMLWQWQTFTWNYNVRIVTHLQDTHQAFDLPVCFWQCSKMKLQCSLISAYIPFSGSVSPHDQAGTKWLCIVMINAKEYCEPLKITKIG